MRKKITFILFCFCLQYCYHDQGDLNINPIEVNIISEGPYAADGTRQIEISAEITKDAKDSFKKVTFYQGSDDTIGNFVNSMRNTIEKNVDTTGKAIVTYRLPQKVGTLIFGASIGASQEFTDEKEIELVVNHPSEIKIENPKNDIISYGEEISINAYLSANSGKSSIDIPVCFNAFQCLGENQKIEVGRFVGLNNAKSNADEKVTANFIADSLTVKKELPILVVVSIKGLETISDTVSLRLLH